MRDIRSLTVRQFRIFPPDIVPFRALRTAPGMEVIKKRYKFRESAIDAGELLFAAGMFAKEAGRGVVSVSGVQINERRVIVEVDGTSADATEVYEDLRQLMFSVEPLQEPDLAEPVVLTEETQCTVTLDFGWEDLFNERLSGYVTGPFRDRLSNPNPAKLNLVNARFSFQFTPLDERIRAFGANLTDKHLTIEPRANYPLEARRFFTVSPLGSDTHFEVLREIETLLTHRKRRRLPPPG